MIDPMRGALRGSLAAVLVAASCGVGTATCGPVEGGRSGAVAQLHYASAGERFIAFTLGHRARSPGGMEVPAYRVTRRAPGEFEIELRGVHVRNPDGSPSYEERPFTGEGVRDVTLESGADGVLRWSVQTDGGRCPRAFERVYVGGTTFPRAQLFVTFGADAAVAFEPPSAAARAPVTVSAVGFTPRSAVRIEVGGRPVRETAADAAGVVYSVLFLPDVAPGAYRVVLRDASGRAAAAAIEVVPR